MKKTKENEKMKNKKMMRKENERKSAAGALAGKMIGMPNPVSALTEEEARKIADGLGEGKDMGSWKTMSGEQFMKWWESSHKETPLPNSGGAVGLSEKKLGSVAGAGENSGTEDHFNNLTIGDIGGSMDGNVGGVCGKNTEHEGEGDTGGGEICN